MPLKNIATKKTSKYATADGHVYLTKRLTVSKAQAAGRKAASQAMARMGFVVAAEGDRIVKLFADGSREVVGTI